MFSPEFVLEFRSRWLPHISTPGLTNLIELLATKSPKLIHGAFEDSNGGGCLASHAAEAHPVFEGDATAGESWLELIGLNAGESKVVQEWDSLAKHHKKVCRRYLITLLSEELRNRIIADVSLDAELAGRAGLGKALESPTCDHQTGVGAFEQHAAPGAVDVRNILSSDEPVIELAPRPVLEGLKEALALLGPSLCLLAGSAFLLCKTGWVKLAYRAEAVLDWLDPPQEEFGEGEDDASSPYPTVVIHVLSVTPAVTTFLGSPDGSKTESKLGSAPGLMELQPATVTADCNPAQPADQAATNRRESEQAR